MSAVNWTALLVPIAVGLSFALFRRLFPARRNHDAGASLTDVYPNHDADPPLTDAERRVYWRWEVAGILPILALVPLLSYAWYLVLRGVAGLFDHATPETLYLVQPIPQLWLLPALFIGTISSAIPLDWIYRALLRERFRRFEHYCNDRMGCDTTRVFWWFVALIAAGTAFCFVFVVTSFARFEETGVQIGRHLALRSTFYDYARVQEIEHRASFLASNGKSILRPHHVITFDDGSTWNSRGGLRDPEPDLDGRIVQHVARKSGKLIVERP